MDFTTLMFDVPLAHWEILIGGTLIFFLLGWLWYNPITPIGKVWISYFPMPKKGDMPKPSQIVVMIFLQFAMGFIVTHTVVTFYLFALSSGLDKALATLFIVKIFMGFVFIKDIGHWYFENKPFPLVLVGIGYYLVGIL